MTASDVLGFSENLESMTFAEGLAFIARTRRQLDRFDVAFPDAESRRMPAEAEAHLRRILDDLESDIFCLTSS